MLSSYTPIVCWGLLKIPPRRDRTFLKVTTHHHYYPYYPLLLLPTTHYHYYPYYPLLLLPTTITTLTTHYSYYPLPLPLLPCVCHDYLIIADDFKGDNVIPLIVNIICAIIYTVIIYLINDKYDKKYTPFHLLLVFDQLLSPLPHRCYRGEVYDRGRGRWGWFFVLTRRHRARDTARQPPSSLTGYSPPPPHTHKHKHTCTRIHKLHPFLFPFPLSPLFFPLTHHQTPILTYTT